MVESHQPHQAHSLLYKVFENPEEELNASDSSSQKPVYQCPQIDPYSDFIILAWDPAQVQLPAQEYLMVDPDAPPLTEADLAKMAKKRE
jgi:hypothetical protein